MISIQKKYNVAVLGAAGGIGQPLSLLLSLSPMIQKLHLYDVVPVVRGVAVDLSHIESGADVLGFAGDVKDASKSAEALGLALKDMNLVVIPAGLPRKPGMTRDDLFSVNAKIVADLVTGVAKHCPQAIVCIISNPVNSTIPIAAEILKKYNCYDPRKLFGVSTLDIVRANKFVATSAGMAPRSFEVPVIGGHSGVSILPLLSKVPVKLSEKEIEDLTDRIQNAGTKVVEAKAGGGSATLSMAYAGYRFATSVMRGLSGEAGVYEYTYVANNLTELPYCACRVLLGPQGVASFEPFGPMSEYETKKMNEQVKPELESNIAKGIKFAASL